ncbi:MAG: hypothetical protein MJZ41_16835 [Bacteroidaceae bacterium]|nr:hypothetical protein [Bacteroidaceae bacterium]
MAYYSKNILEEELKNKVAKEWFQRYDTTQIVGKIDFCVSVPVGNGPQLFETESLLWAEAKKGTKQDIWESFVQLILTIGKARTFDRHLPPAFLGAFDAEKIAFVPYNTVLDVFYQNDFNWNVTPSDHQTKEFQQLYELVSDTLHSGAVKYRFDEDEKELRHFIRNNFIVGKSRQTKVRINKNNFTAIYQKWCQQVKPTIAVNWELVSKSGIIDADFYLADILSEHNLTLREKLYVLLRADHYELARHIDTQTGLFSSSSAPFTDKQKAHHEFWQRYNRPPKREYWDYIVERRDLLVPQNIREIKGTYFTPPQWVELSQQYLAMELGEDWQDEYYIWDCAAGTGNLLAGLTNKYNIWASTIDPQDVDIMHDRIKRMNDNSSNGQGANLLESHVFQFDFLNDSFDKLPDGLRQIVNDPERRKKLVVYINPPYAEASNARTITGTGENRVGLSTTMIKEKYKKELGRAANELFAQFYVRVVRELHYAILAEFSKLKILQGPNFKEFRTFFPAKLGRFFCVPADTFDNVSGQFPIGFKIWNTGLEEEFVEAEADIYDAKGECLGRKTIFAYKDCRYIIEWLRQYFDKKGDLIAYWRYLGNDFLNQNGVFITLNPTTNDIKKVNGSWMSKSNVREYCIYFATRMCIPSDWLNDRDQFLYPNDGWKSDHEFQTNCLIFALFHGQNRISSQHGANHWIPFTETEVNAQNNFESHFMSDYLHGKYAKKAKPNTQQSLFEDEETTDDYIPINHLSESAKAVLDAGRELWQYYHAQPNANPNASLYDIRLHFQGVKVTKSGKEQMNSESNDARYTELISNLRQSLKVLASEIRPKVYEYGFLKK